MRLPDTVDTPRMHGRRITRQDLDYVVRTDGDMTIQASVFGKTFTPEESRERLERWIQIEDESGLGFYLFFLPSGEIVGHAGLFPSRTVPGETEVGYILLPEHWGKGYATEMTLAFLALAFDGNVERVIAVTAPSNVASQRVMEKAGMHFETSFSINGAAPAVRYAAVRDAWKRRTAT